jgi:hypothetical protein
MKKVIVFLMFLMFVPVIPEAMAEEKYVCLVYFTSHGCGDDCGLTDTFMDGLLSEYNNSLISIAYYVDASQENQNVFQAYRNAYILPQNVPMVLFGKGDYLQGINDIYANTEAKIFSFLQMNGTNCPLEIGYVPPSQLIPGSLPGNPQIMSPGKKTGESTGNEDGGLKPAPPTDNRSLAERGNQEPFVPFVEHMNEESFHSLIIVLVAVVLVLSIGFILWWKSQMKMQ